MKNKICQLLLVVVSSSLGCLTWESNARRRGYRSFGFRWLTDEKGSFSKEHAGSSLHTGLSNSLIELKKIQIDMLFQHSIEYFYVPPGASKGLMVNDVICIVGRTFAQRWLKVTPPSQKMSHHTMGMPTRTLTSQTTILHQSTCTERDNKISQASKVKWKQHHGFADLASWTAGHGTFCTCRG